MPVKVAVLSIGGAPFHCRRHTARSGDAHRPPHALGGDGPLHRLCCHVPSTCHPQAALTMANLAAHKTQRTPSPRKAKHTRKGEALRHAKLGSSPGGPPRPVTLPSPSACPARAFPTWPNSAPLPSVPPAALLLPSRRPPQHMYVYGYRHTHMYGRTPSSWWKRSVMERTISHRCGALSSRCFREVKYSHVGCGEGLTTLGCWRSSAASA